MAKFNLPDDELQALDQLAHICIVYLVVAGLVTFFIGAYTLPVPPFGVALLGFSGSAVAALTSCLDRYATGFERENGQTYPVDAKKGAGKFNRRFARWLFVRPFLGAVIAPVFVWGLSHFAKNPGEFLGETLEFTAFVGGLLAKSIVDLIKALFKNVFQAGSSE